MSTKKRPQRTGPYRPVERPDKAHEDLEKELEEERKRLDELAEKTRKERNGNQEQPNEGGDDAA